MMNKKDSFLLRKETWERKMNKKGFEMNFTVIFSIIAGVVILFLAIYGAMRFIDVGRTRIDAQTYSKISILLDPLETSLEEGKSLPIELSTAIRLYNNRCSESGNFGSQQMGIAVSSGIGKKWREPFYYKSQYNKYIFSQELEESKKFRVFSKSFEMPFKISDIVIFTDKEYCFIETPEEIEDDLSALLLKNVYFTDRKDNCSETAEKVCFSSSAGCDVAVYKTSYGFESGYIEKQGQKLYYEGPLIYAALFSSPDIYECNVKRLMKRLVSLSSIYQGKIEVLMKKDCNSLLDVPLEELKGAARNLENSRSLSIVYEKAREVELADNAECNIF